MRYYATHNGPIVSSDLNIPSFVEVTESANPQCPMCEGDTVLLGRMANMDWFKCRACGTETTGGSDNE